MRLFTLEASETKRRSSLSIMVIVVAVAGCHSSGITSGSMSATQACTDLVAAQCAQLQTCDPARLQTDFGDVATCQSRMMLSCLPALAAPSTSATPAQYEECAAAVGASACSALFMRTPPTACRATPGQRADGAACGDDAQCASTFCKRLTTQVCGVCSTRTTAGGECTGDADCDFGLSCGPTDPNTFKRVCVSSADLGASCATSLCAAPNYCNIAKVCAAPRSAGMPCSRTLPGASECDATQGLYCNAQSICAAQTYAAAGESCGLGAACTTGGRCIESGTCVSPAPDGGGCAGHSDSSCLLPAVCAPNPTGNGDGTCLLPAPSACM